MLLVVFALPEEARVFQRRLAQRTKQKAFTEGVLGRTKVAVCFVGIRATAISDLETAIQRLQPHLVISSGFAGATRALLEPGDFLIASNYTTTPIGRPLERLIDAVGPFCSVQQVHGPAEKQKLGEFSMAVDMESNTVAAVCARYQIPLITARMISDARGESIPAVFTGGKPGSPKDLIEAGRFVFRMLHLTRLLADRLATLIGYATRDDHRNRFVEPL
jgi:nucleoside phosphorylase